MRPLHRDLFLRSRSPSIPHRPPIASLPGSRAVPPFQPRSRLARGRERGALGDQPTDWGEVLHVSEKRTQTPGRSRHRRRPKQRIEIELRSRSGAKGSVVWRTGRGQASVRRTHEGQSHRERNDDAPTRPGCDLQVRHREGEKKGAEDTIVDASKTRQSKTRMRGNQPFQQRMHDPSTATVDVHEASEGRGPRGGHGCGHMHRGREAWRVIRWLSPYRDRLRSGIYASCRSGVRVVAFSMMDLAVKGG